LENILQRVAKEKFLANYGYNYNGVKSAPPSVVDGTEIHATEDMVSIKEKSQTAHVAQYVEEKIWKYE
jgi:hypothetical protein